MSLNASDGEENFHIYERDYFEDNQLLVATLSQLDKKERTCLLLFEIGGFSIKEIAHIQQEKSESAVKSRLSRTRKKLKEFVEQTEEAGAQNVRQFSSKASLNSNDLYHETSEIINNLKRVGGTNEPF